MPSQTQHAENIHKTFLQYASSSKLRKTKECLRIILKVRQSKHRLDRQLSCCYTVSYLIMQ